MDRFLATTARAGAPELTRQSICFIKATQAGLLSWSLGLTKPLFGNPPVGPDPPEGPADLPVPRRLGPAFRCAPLRHQWSRVDLKLAARIRLSGR